MPNWFGLGKKCVAANQWNTPTLLARRVGKNPKNPPRISRWVSELFVYKKCQTTLNPTREYNGGIVGLRESQGRMLCILLCRNRIPSFSKGQNTGRPTFAVVFPPLVANRGRRIAARGGGPVPNPPGFGCKRGISGEVQAVCTQKRFQTPRFQLTPGGAGPGARAGMAEAAISVDAEIIALGLKESRLKSLPKLQLKKKVAVPVYTSAKWIRPLKQSRWRHKNSHLQRDKSFNIHGS